MLMTMVNNLVIYMQLKGMSKVKIVIANHVKTSSVIRIYIKKNVLNCRAVQFSQQYIREDSSPQHTEITIPNMTAVAIYTGKVKQIQRIEGEIKYCCIEKHHLNQTLYQLAAEWGKQWYSIYVSIDGTLKDDRSMKYEAVLEGKKYLR